MPKVSGSWNDSFLSYHLPFSFFLGFFFFMDFSVAHLKTRELSKHFFFYAILLILLLTGLKSVSFVIDISGSTDKRFCQIKYLSNISIGFIFSLCLLIKKHKNRPACSRQGIANYLCHTSYTTWVFLLSCHLLSALISLVHRANARRALEICVFFCCT